ncbi:Rne/Rng family ribonuclease [Naasia sp. SYSU D00948]|uniref:Rne/Rng family ribonuclease n=1 Tax=Naasia sp. SYSU D00948 TaxID=2817379 RepID=UPI001FEE62ED|nr:Rne/Rng family ribonuclease [Naasia sp. SYSU D00948]
MPRRASTGLGSVPVVEPEQIPDLLGGAGVDPAAGAPGDVSAPESGATVESAGGAVGDIEAAGEDAAVDASAGDQPGSGADAASSEDDQAPAADGQSVTDRSAPQESADAGDEQATTADATRDEQATSGAEAATQDDEQPQVELPLRPTGPTTLLFFQAPPVIAPARDEDPVEAEPEAETAQPSTRRRNRRRSGANGAVANGAAEERAEQREEEAPRPRRRVVEEITEPQKVKGSTRLEAKKQRRRDGRDAGRRRAVVTEAEFLARRESVERVMVVRSASGRIEIGVLEDGVLAEHYVAKAQNQSLIGNVYLGRVQNVLPSMEAAFVDIGRGRNAVLYSGEVDWDAAAENGEKNQPRRIELALKAGDKVLVQVTKDPVGHKGARLTSQISLPGRYLVYVPNGSMNGISRKLPDTERARLKRILKEVLPEGVGVIVRTAAEGATEEQLTVDVNRLTAQWQHISSQVEKVQAPALLHSEPDLLVKIIRDVFNEDFSRLVIAGEDAQTTIENYLASVAPDLLDRVERYSGGGDVFTDFRIQEQIDKALERKVWLPSGGSLVIDRTEAMTVIDVNTGKFVGSGGNLEETVTKNNLEAAEEIVRQLRLRDVGGIIVIDFIDMVLETNRDLVLRRLVECLSRDRTKHQVAEVTSLGLVQMTRKKLGLGLAESMVDAPPRPVESKQEPRRRGKTPPAPTVRPAAGSTHGITDDARNALALIAASTLHKDHHHEHPAAPAVEPAAAAAPVAAAEPIIELPLPEVVPAPKSREIAPDAESLLGAVLDALPEPKKPGQGRSRSRRVSTPALTPGARHGADDH